MSKSLGNSPDPLDLIKQYGADAIRTGMLFSAPAGNDLLYDEKLVEQGRNFANKVWNAFRLVKGWSTGDHAQPEENKGGVLWFENKLHESLSELEDNFNKFRISDALHTVHKLIWDNFCDRYLEIIKPEFGKPIDIVTYNATVSFFEVLLKALHPFMPFITEELWHELQNREEKDCIIVASAPVPKSYDHAIIDEGALAFEIVTEVRNTRNTKGISPKESLKLLVKHGDRAPVKLFWPIVKKLSNLSAVEFVSEAPSAGATTFIIKSTEFFIPLDGQIDIEKERATILKEIEYQRGFLTSVDKKLSNEKFVASAPAQVVEAERKKKADAETKIDALEKSLAKLK
jgi:valyl-tRNA synthetase